MPKSKLARMRFQLWARQQTGRGDKSLQTLRGPRAVLRANLRRAARQFAFAQCAPKKRSMSPLNKRAMPSRCWASKSHTNSPTVLAAWPVLKTIGAITGACRLHG